VRRPRLVEPTVRLPLEPRAGAVAGPCNEPVAATPAGEEGDEEGRDGADEGAAGAGEADADAVEAAGGCAVVGNGADVVGNGADVVGSGADVVGSGVETVGSDAEVVGSGRDTVGSGNESVSGSVVVGRVTCCGEVSASACAAPKPAAASTVTDAASAGPLIIRRTWAAPGWVRDVLARRLATTWLS
jgi:hypothetical protein